MRAALEWSRSEGTEPELGLRLAKALWWFWFERGYWTEGREQLDGLLALPGAKTRTKARAHALHAAGELAKNLGGGSAASALFEESLAIFQEQGDKNGMGWSLNYLGSLAADDLGEYEAARALSEAGLAIFREL